MNFDADDATIAIRDQVEAFFQREILPRAHDWHEEMAAPDRCEASFMARLKARAFEQGLWNMALPRLTDDEPGTRLTNLQFAYVGEILGRLSWASEIFNCHAPDVPNMEILQMFATPEQKETYLRPLLHGESRSSFAMTEPDVASSDATNIATRVDINGEKIVINGRKWFASGAGNPNCKFIIVVGLSDPDAQRGKGHSMVIVPKNTPGLTVVRNIPVMHHVDRVSPHTELLFEDVTVPVENLLGAPGEGFLMGQARLGPARVHHCMRAIGRCEVMLRLMLERARSRTTFGKNIREYANFQDAISESRMELEQARLLVQRTAWLLDRDGNKAVRKDVSIIKIAVARAYYNIANRGVQVFGAMGLTSEAPFASALAQARAFRIYDGPDEVHSRTIFRLEERESLADKRSYSDQYLH
jgi:acyl-CoA dehydrogenase